MLAPFKEQIFIHSGNNSTFFTAKRISTLAIFVEKKEGYEDESEFDIEFSLPDSDQILKARIAILNMDETEICLKIRKMSPKDLSALDRYAENWNI